MNIKEKIKEVEDYFKDKISNGDFEIKGCSEFTVQILIDNQYSFNLWVANDPKTGFNFYYHTSDEEKGITFSFNTEKERLKAWRKVKPLVEGYRNSVLKVKKEKELKRLQKEIEQLNM